MKQYLHQLRQGLILGLSFGLTASAVFGGAYFAIKARSTSKSTTDSDTSAIYSSAGDTLTAVKRNTLVDKVNTPKNIISCSVGGTSCPSAHWTKTFIASDCGGILPDSNYYPVIGAVQFGGWWQINAYMGTPSVELWCTNTTAAYYVRITYIHK